MIATLSTLYPAAHKPRLIEAVRLRTSCRSFSGAPSTADYAALSYAVGRYALPGARLALIPVDDSHFTATLLGMRRITGCRLAAAVIIRDVPHARLHAGILGESLVLEATSLGLGTCWVSGSYRRKGLAVPLTADEEMLCIIAIGTPAMPLTPPQSRHRKPPEHFCRGDYRRWPDACLLAATLVQQAPSAMNMQPWTLWLGQQDALVLDTSDRAELDAGIALCHAELALDMPHAWQYGATPSEPTAWVVPK